MSTTRIPYSVSTPYGALVAELAAHVVKAKQLADRIKAGMDAMSSAPATDSTAIANELGMPAPTNSTGATGEGSVLYTVIANAVVNVGAAAAEMNKIDQGMEI